MIVMMMMSAKVIRAYTLIVSFMPAISALSGNLGLQVFLILIYFSPKADNVSFLPLLVYNEKFNDAIMSKQVQIQIEASANTNTNRGECKYKYKFRPVQIQSVVSAQVTSQSRLMLPTS